MAQETTDVMFLLNCTFYCVFQHFEVDTKDLADLAWSPDGRVLCLWESLLRVSWSRHSQYCSNIFTEFRLEYLMAYLITCTSFLQ